jgi:transcriptional regulator with XRE-family HTH domain
MKKDKWKTPERIEKIQELFGAGLKKKDIAKRMGIARSTLYNWMRDEEDILNASKNGREDLETEGLLALRIAIVDHPVEETFEETIRDKNGDVVSHTQRRTVKIIPANALLIAFLLKNANPEFWKGDRVHAAEAERAAMGAAGGSPAVIVYDV